MRIVLTIGVPKCRVGCELWCTTTYKDQRESWWHGWYSPKEVADWWKTSPTDWRFVGYEKRRGEDPLYQFLTLPHPQEGQTPTGYSQTHYDLHDGYAEFSHQFLKIPKNCQGKGRADFAREDSGSHGKGPKEHSGRHNPGEVGGEHRRDGLPNPGGKGQDKGTSMGKGKGGRGDTEAEARPSRIQRSRSPAEPVVPKLPSTPPSRKFTSELPVPKPFSVRPPMASPAPQAIHMRSSSNELPKALALPPSMAMHTGVSSNGLPKPPPVLPPKAMHNAPSSSRPPKSPSMPPPTAMHAGSSSDRPHGSAQEGPIIIEIPDDLEDDITTKTEPTT